MPEQAGPVSIALHPQLVEIPNCTKLDLDRITPSSVRTILRLQIWPNFSERTFVMMQAEVTRGLRTWFQPFAVLTFAIHVNETIWRGVKDGSWNSNVYRQLLSGRHSPCVDFHIPKTCCEDTKQILWTCSNIQGSLGHKVARFWAGKYT